MDTDNSQIYKVAKYLDKYTKDGNKKGSMYLQKLNNYLHKVQHGGSNMQIVEEIQRMVGQVIEKHDEEGKALTKKLQELGRMHSLDQPVNYESVKLKLEEKIKDAPVAQQAQTKSPTALVAQQTQTKSPTTSTAPVAPVAPSAQQAELTPDKIQNMTLKEFATIAVKRAGIEHVKGVDNVENILKGLTFEQLTKDDMTPIFKKVVFFQISPKYIEPIIKQLVAMKAEIETEYSKSSMNSPTGRLIDIFKNPNSSTPALVAPALVAPTRASKSESGISTFNVLFYTNDGEEAQFDTQYFNSNLRDKVDAIIKERLSITDNEFQTYEENGITLVGYYDDNKKTYTYNLKHGKMLIPLISAVNKTDKTIDVGNTKFRIFILPFIENKSIKQIETIIKEEIKKLPFLRENLKTQMFYVQGYVVDPETNGLKKYKFPENKDQDKSQNKILDHSFVEKYMSQILDTLKLTDSDVYKTSEYDILNNEIIIIFSKPQKIVEFVDRINKSKTYIELPSSKNDPTPTHVRLFIRPRPPISVKNIEDEDEDEYVQEYEKAVNKLSSEIFSELQVLRQALSAPPQAVPQSPQASSAPAAAPQPQIPSPENLTTNAFVVVGHIVVDSQTNFLGKRYDFPTQKETINIDGKNVEIDVLQKDYRKNILDELVLEDNDVNSSLSYKVTKGVKIVLQSQENIKKFVDSINKHKRIVNNLPIGKKQEKVSVRLFVKPMSYKDTKDPIQLAINELERNIDAEINAIVMASASSQAGPALSAQPLASTASSAQPQASEPTATKFHVVGFYKDNSIKRFRIPPESAHREKVLELFTKSNPPIYDKIKQIEFIDDKNPEGSEEKSEDKKKRNVNRARITFSEPLPVRTTLESVNNRVPLEPVVFEFGNTSSYNVYMFIVPVEKSEDEMAKIEKKMGQLVQERQQRVSSSAQLISSARTPQSTASSARTAQSTASYAQSTTVRQSASSSTRTAQSASSSTRTAQSASSAPIRRGGASNASKGGSRGPYRHPNEEYNL